MSTHEYPYFRKPSYSSSRVFVQDFLKFTLNNPTIYYILYWCKILKSTSSKPFVFSVVWPPLMRVNTSFFPLVASRVKKTADSKHLGAIIPTIGRIPNKPQIGNAKIFAIAIPGRNSQSQSIYLSLDQKKINVQGISQVAGALDQSKMIMIKR